MPTNERRELVRRLVRGGHAQYVIADLAGVSAPTVTRDIAWLKRRGKLK